MRNKINIHLADLYNDTKKKLDNFNIESSEIDSKVIIKNILGLDDKDLIMNTELSLSKNASEKLSQVIAERTSGKPISRIFGNKEFFSMNFDINKFVLDPRPDTEVLVEVALNLIKKYHFKTILDLGIGSGCITAGILKNSEDTYVLGIDISEKAVRTAKNNLIKNDITNFDLIVGDWGQSLNKKFDIIVSNPPYIITENIQNLPKEVKFHDPLLSLDGGSDGLKSYRSIAYQTFDLLADNGFLLLEIGYSQYKYVEEIFLNHDFKLMNKVKDYNGLDRVLVFKKKKIKKIVEI